MTKLDDETLLAFADGELDSQQMELVATQLTNDPEARETLRIFQESAALVKDAFDQPLHEPVPDRLLQTINETEPDASVSDMRLARQKAGTAKRQKPVFSTLAAAASVALVVGLASGYATFRVAATAYDGYTSPLLMTNDGLLSQALETTASGSLFDVQDAATAGSRQITPLLTFQDQNRRFCREYEETITTQSIRRDLVGVACRAGDGSWIPETVMARKLVAATLPSENIAASVYVPAAGADIAPFDLVIDAMMTDEPISPTEEQQLLREGWKVDSIPDA
ncbi:MAG: hypothetical protein V2J55_12805 [Candidatus Competibacteraceae bacterium]|jgi:hypothetical protein|nr:hypothetical protein [Candidatus Competibacteraceae bacterium]